MIAGFDAKRFFNNNTGLGNYSRSVIAGLAQYYPENSYLLYTPEINDNKHLEFANHYSSIQIIKSTAVIKSLWRSFGIGRQLQKDHVQLYHGLSNEIPLGLRKRNIPSVVTIHDLIFRVLPSTYPVIDRRVYNFKFRYACKNSDRIIAISESTRNDIIEHYKIEPEKISVAYQSAASLFFEPQNKIATNKVIASLKLPSEYLLYVGSITERKNILVLLEALYRLPVGERIPLLIVGKGAGYRAKAELFIKEKKLKDLIIWLDNLSDNYQLQAVYQQAAAFIYPSRYEGFGIPVAEALLSGTPVIASNKSSIPEAGGPGSVYFNPDDAEELSDKIKTVLNDKELRTKMVETGLIYAKENFNLKTTTDRLIEIYRQIS